MHNLLGVICHMSMTTARLVHLEGGCKCQMPMLIYVNTKDTNKNKVLHCRKSNYLQLCILVGM